MCVTVYTFYFTGSMVDCKESETFPLNPEELSQDAPAMSLTSSIDLHIVNTSSEANEQVSFSVIEKVSSGEPKSSQTVPPVEASSPGSPIVQQLRKHTEDTQQSTQFVEGCPASEGSKDAVDLDAGRQVLPQQCEETILEENLTEVVNVPGNVLFGRSICTALFFVYCCFVETLPYLFTFCLIYVVVIFFLLHFPQRLGQFWTRMPYMKTLMQAPWLILGVKLGHIAGKRIRLLHPMGL